jgi:hypothetical protein
MVTPIATFKEFCVDVHEDGDVAAFSRFWAAAAGLRLDDGDLVGPEEGQGIAICPVPEPKTVKHRVHPDISVHALDEVLDLGATVIRPQDDPSVEGGIRWTVMADPEGGEFCAFVRPPEQIADYRVFEFCVDSVDAGSIAAWWAEVFGVEAQEKDDYWWFHQVPGFPSGAVAPFFAMVFGNVPEPKTVKNRWHWDVYGEVDDFLARGANTLWQMPRWTVLADPEGYVFCVFPPRRDG